MKTIISNKIRLKSLVVFSLLICLLSNYKTHAVSNNFNLKVTEPPPQLPSFLLGTYTGNLMYNSSINTNGTCTIIYSRNSSYTLAFSNGAGSFKNIVFSKDDDTYTASFIYKNKTFFVVVDEDGDLSVNATGYSNTLSFSGEIDINHRSTSTHSNNNQSIHTGNNGVSIRNGNQTIDTYGNGDVSIKNGNQTINTNQNGTTINTPNSRVSTRGNNTSIHTDNVKIHTNNPRKRRSNGNVSISTNGNGVNINGSVNIGNNDPHTDVVVCSGWTNCTIPNCSHANAPSHYYDCGSHEIAQLPLNALGFYRGKLNGYNVDTRKGICKIVETGCKTYRLEFSNNLPPIHGVQFGRINNFDEYTSLVIEGQYSSAIEIDMSFNDLSIDGEIMTIEFDGDKE